MESLDTQRPAKDYMSRERWALPAVIFMTVVAIVGIVVVFRELEKNSPW